MSIRSRTRAAPDIWPGFVDALAALLVVIIFLLVVFVLAQVFLSQALTGRDQALERLNNQVNELVELLALERDTTASLRLNVTQLSSSLQRSTEDRDQLVLRLDGLASRNDVLSEQVLALQARAEAAEAELAQAGDTIAADRESIRAQLSEIESLRRDIQALRQVRTDLEGRVASLAALMEVAQEQADSLAQELAASRNESTALAGELETSRESRARLEAEVARILAANADLESDLEETWAAATTLDADLEKSRQLEAVLREQSAELDAALTEIRSVAGALRDRATELEVRLATEEERTLLSQREIERRDVQLAEVQALYLARGSELDEQTRLSDSATARVSALNLQLLAIRQQLLSLQDALEISEARDREQEVVISDLGARLNQALAAKVEELSRYRSEFFGRLREVLGQRRDITIVGDRFVFQSEVLFASGRAELGDDGKSDLAEIAATLLEITSTIPEDITWVLRVDGHTDAIPIATPQFPSNWELSAARAISVVQFLIERGIPAQRLAATGFGEFQPIDPGIDEIANRRNRRIELKLTER
jgi:chemotaxis protein MotB